MAVGRWVTESGKYRKRVSNHDKKNGNGLEVAGDYQ